MEVKAFHLQAPEAIAKEYGGNKIMIAKAAQTGVIDPTAAVLAGMFIDRMRAAQMQEMQPKQTIAQQVFAPPAPAAPPAGLAAIPPAGAGMPPAGPPAPPAGPPPAPMMNASQGMAEGGLASLPVPDAMFDEPVDAESFAGGGIVAFADGGMYAGFEGIDPDTGLPLAPASGLAAIAPAPAAAPTVDPTLAYVERFKNLIDAGRGPDADKYTKMQTAMLEREMSPEAQKAQRKRDLWMTLGQIGASMAASKSPSFLGALGEAGQAAIPGIQRAEEARKAAQRSAISALAGDEKATRNERIQTVAAALAQQQNEIKNKADQDKFEFDKRNAADRLGMDQHQLDETIRAHQASERLQQAQIGATSVARSEARADRLADIRNKAVDNVRAQIAAEQTAAINSNSPVPTYTRQEVQRMVEDQYAWLTGSSPAAPKNSFTPVTKEGIQQLLQGRGPRTTVDFGALD